IGSPRRPFGDRLRKHHAGRRRRSVAPAGSNGDDGRAGSELDRRHAGRRSRPGDRGRSLAAAARRLDRKCRPRGDALLARLHRALLRHRRLHRQDRSPGRIGYGEDDRRRAPGDDQRILPRHQHRRRRSGRAEGLLHRHHLPDPARPGHHRRRHPDRARRILDPDGGGGMNWLKKGPELKLSELKVPGFLHDLFYDLKERHLLPLVVLLIVAMVAAPIYFKGSTESDPQSTASPGTTATGSTAVAGGEALVVAHSEPGLREYKRRLKHYRALDPFEEHGGEEAASPEVSSTTSSATTGEVPAEATVIGGESSGTVEVPAEAFAPETSGGAESAGGGKTRTRYAADAIDVRIVTVAHHSTEEKKAQRAKPKAKTLRNLPELTMLPNRQTPAATYIGLSNDGKKALFVISSDIVSLFGEGNCVIGSQSCQLLALEPGLPETFV